MPLYRILFLIDLWFKDVKLHLTLKNKQKTNIQEFKKKNIQLFSCFLVHFFPFLQGELASEWIELCCAGSYVGSLCAKKNYGKAARSQRGSDNVSVVLLRADPCRLFNSSHFLHVSLTRRRALRARLALILQSCNPTHSTQTYNTHFIWDMCVCVCVCVCGKKV